MIILCQSDTHGDLRPIESNYIDTYVHAGDFCPVWNHDIKYQRKWLLEEFVPWIRDINAEHKVIVAGNHDLIFEDEPEFADEFNDRLPANAIYLCDNGIVLDDVRFYGTPYQPRFNNWAFNMDDGPGLSKKYNEIDYDTQVLVTHCPPRNILDSVGAHNMAHYGSVSLAEAVYRLQDLKLCVFGHIHDSYGHTYKEIDGRVIDFVNASAVNENYIFRQNGYIEIEV